MTRLFGIGAPFFAVRGNQSVWLRPSGARPRWGRTLTPAIRILPGSIRWSTSRRYFLGLDNALPAAAGRFQFGEFFINGLTRRRNLLVRVLGGDEEPQPGRLLLHCRVQDRLHIDAAFEQIA